MKELMMARETAENVAELIERGTQSTHMRNIANDIRKLVAEAEELGYLVVTAHKRVSVECACGCGRLFIPAKNGRMKKYYNDTCRQRANRKQKARRNGWTEAEEAALAKAWEDGLGTQAIANSLSRTARSVRSKYAELKRKGLVR